MENVDKYSIVFVTCNSFDNARNISRILVSEHIAACCTIVHNVLSIYNWEGSIEESMEYLIIIKSSKSNLSILESRILELHNYSVPEIISLPIESISEPYLNWMSKELS